VREPSIRLQVGECPTCHGVIYPNPHFAGHTPTWQECQRCSPTAPVGSGRQDTRGAENERKVQARANGQKSYVSVERCPTCKGWERFTVGSRCVRCVSIEYADGSTVVVAPGDVVPKPKRTMVAHPLADAARNSARQHGEVSYVAVDWACITCSSTERSVRYNFCSACNRNRTRQHRGGFNQPA
jgi:hypothetical protein